MSGGERKLVLQTSFIYIRPFLNMWVRLTVLKSAQKWSGWVHHETDS